MAYFKREKHTDEMGNGLDVVPEKEAKLEKVIVTDVTPSTVIVIDESPAYLMQSQRHKSRYLAALEIEPGIYVTEEGLRASPNFDKISEQVFVKRRRK